MIQPFGHTCRNATLLRVGIRLRTIFIPSLVVTDRQTGQKDNEPVAYGEPFYKRSPKKVTSQPIIEGISTWAKDTGSRTSRIEPLIKLLGHMP